MARVFIALIFCVTMALAANDQQQCPENQEWSICATACPQTCTSHPHGKPGKCMGLCIEGCRCKPGYVLKSEGVCVKPNQC